MTLLHAIRELEKACLSKDSALTTRSELVHTGRKAAKDYYAWLRRNAQATASFLPFFEDLKLPHFAPTTA